MAEPLKRVQVENLSISGCRIVGIKHQNAPAFPCGALERSLRVGAGGWPYPILCTSLSDTVFSSGVVLME